MDDETKNWFEKVFLRKSDPVAACATDLEALIADHGHEAVQAALAKSIPDPATPPEALDVDDLELTDDDLTALGLTRVAKEGPTLDERITAAVEKAVAKLAPPEVTKTEPVSPDFISLAKQGVPIDAIEGAKSLLEHADETVRQATAELLVKQADPKIQALLKSEAGSARIPKADEDETKGALDALAKQAGEKPNGKVSPEIEAALKVLAANGGSN
jgi:hypothetical protein